MNTASFVRTILLMGTGPIVWACHFLLVYGLTGIGCARPTLRQEWVVAGIAAATISALAIMAGFILHCRRTADVSPNGRFVRRTATSLGLLSGVAIVWEALPVLLVPVCG